MKLQFLPKSTGGGGEGWNAGLIFFEPLSSGTGKIGLNNDMILSTTVIGSVLILYTA